MNSYLHIKSFLGQEKTIELLGGWSPLSCKDKVKKIKNWLKNQSLLSIDQKKELEMTPALETEAPVASTSSKPAPEMSKDKPKGPQKKQRGPKNHQGKGKGKANWHRPYPQGYRIPKFEPSAVDSVFNMARTHGIHSQGAGKDEQDLSTQINHVQSSINVEIGKLDAKLTKITLDICDLKRHDKKYTEWHKLTNARFDSIINACSRIESTLQVQNDEM
ncbi:hypothetical protein O181_117862 [Austropuccinia psidii MF-1]|uniref:Uncharacterized protein n=1 Tax=Austropuccinia psidii MF-1 TaxID=1389203 RepID=A0A9Q3KE60_9BASI|nr:hypothetical protein [Austropuccinia psidii MF-1]